MKNLRNKTEGFTIIEVLIVLAIAGLIMLIVFLAVPALQRNSRNTQRRNDVATYLGAVNEFIANNNGKVPVTADVPTINDLANTGLLTEPTTVSAVAAVGSTNVGTMLLHTSARCENDANGGTTTGSSRQIAVTFAVENSTGGGVPQCQET